MQNQTKALERALPIVASAYADQFGIDVIFSGDTAMTDGNRIILPLVNNLSEMRQVYFGYLAHEASHIKFTDLSVVSETQSFFEKNLLNLIEDVRIEGEIQKEYPGTEYTLCAMEQYLFDEGITGVVNKDANEASILFVYLYVRLYGEVLKRQCYNKVLIDNHCSLLLEVFPQGFLTKLDVIIEKYCHNLDSTQQSLKIARRILSSLKEAEQEQSENQSEKENSNVSEPDDLNQDQNGQPLNDSFEHSEQNNSNEGEQNTGNISGDLSGDKQSSDQSLFETISTETDLPIDVMDQVKDLLQQNAKEENQKLGVVQGASLNAFDVGKDPTFSDGNVNELQEGVLASSVIRSRVLGLLQAKSREKRTLHHRGKKFDSRRISKIAIGDPSVFIRKDQQKQPNTAIHLLLDNSGSMNRVQGVANQAAISLGLAISMVPKCEIAVSAFPGNRQSSVCPIIRYGQPVRSNAHRFNIKSTGSTPLAEAMFYAVRHLAETKQEKKVLIVVTDGDPDDANSVHYMNGLVKNHVEVYAIGIQSNAVKNFFKNWCVINNINELQNALFDVAKTVLKIN